MTYDEENKGLDGVPYWRCQSHIRSLSSEIATKENEEISKSVTCSNSAEIRRHLENISTSLTDESVDDEQKQAALKLAKLLERKKRKIERIERKISYRSKNPSVVDTPRKPRYEICLTCKNPKSANCEHELCRACCKDKVFTQNIECKGHGLRVKVKNCSVETTG